MEKILQRSGYRTVRGLPPLLDPEAHFSIHGTKDEKIS
jgi:hypothetical protein